MSTSKYFLKYGWPLADMLHFPNSNFLRPLLTTLVGNRPSDFSLISKKVSCAANWVVVYTYELRAATAPVKFTGDHINDFGTWLAHGSGKVNTQSPVVISVLLPLHIPPPCAGSELVVHRWCKPFHALECKRIAYRTVTARC